MLTTKKVEWIKTLIVFVLVIAIVSCSGLIEQHVIKKDQKLQYIESRQETAASVTALCAAASIAIGAVPDDSTTPVAQQISDAADYLLLSTIAMTIEKILLNFADKSCLRILSIITGLIFVAHIWIKKISIARLGVITLSLTVCLYLAVPITIWISTGIDKAIDFEGRMDSLNNSEEGESEAIDESEDDRNWFERTYDSIANTVEAAANKISDLFAYAKDLYTLLIDVIVGFMLTTVVLPICTVLFLKWVVNIAIGFLPINSLIHDKKESLVSQQE